MEAVEQRPESVERHGAATGLDEHLGRHSRNNLNTIDPDACRILHANLRCVVGLIRALVDQTVGRNVRHSPMEPWYAALIVGQQIHVGAQSGTDHIDVLGPDARNHDEPILPGNQIHERCAGANDAASGMKPQVRYHAILGRVDGIDGLYVATAFSGSGFKIAPAVGMCMAELITEGRAKTVDIEAFSLRRFALGKSVEGPYPYAPRPDHLDPTTAGKA